jgi:hypothetical protein
MAEDAETVAAISAERRVSVSTSDEGMRRRRERQRKGLRCVTIELRESEVDALIRRRARPSQTIGRTPPLYDWRCTASLISICGDA